jgi:cobalt-zinc-cadmium efflux system outer membrane protein
MRFQNLRTLAVSFGCFVLALVAPMALAFAQDISKESRAASGLQPSPWTAISRPLEARNAEPDKSSDSVVSRYSDAAQGASSNDLVNRALAANAELSAARLDIDRARARLHQARLRPNPTIDFEQITGRLTGSAGERETSIGLALPIELGQKRQRRIDLAQVGLAAAEAEVADRERRLIAEVRGVYGEALAALRELVVTEGINQLDQQTARLVEARITEGESAPLELSLLHTEVDRLKSRRALVEGRLQASLLRLKALVGIAPETSLRLREDLTAPSLYKPPMALEAALDMALRTRPDLRLARLGEKAAEAGFELARAQSRPDVTAFTKFSANRSIFDNTPVGVLRDQDKLLSFGVSVSIPLFNRNQGAKAEAATAIAQARHRREFAEQVVRSEVASAYARYEASQSALTIFEQGVLARSTENIKSIRGAYELGAFRMTELLAEQRRLLDSQREYTEALTERYKALADLLSAMGAPAAPGATQKEE